MNVACFFRTCQLAHVMDLSSVAVILKDFLKALRSKRHDHGEHLASCLDRQQCWILKGTVFGTEIPILDSKDPQQKIRPKKSGFSGLGAYALRKVASTTSDVFHVLKAAKLKKNLGFFNGCVVESWKMMLPKIRLDGFFWGVLLWNDVYQQLSGHLNSIHLVLYSESHAAGRRNGASTCLDPSFKM